MEDVALLCEAVGRANSPFSCGGRDHTLAENRACLAQRHIALVDGRTAARPNRTLRLQNRDLLPVNLRLFRENHGQRSVDSLAHFRFVDDELDLAIRLNADPSVERILCFAIVVKPSAQAKTENKCSPCRRRGREKPAAAYLGSRFGLCGQWVHSSPASTLSSRQSQAAASPLQRNTQIE